MRDRVERRDRAQFVGRAADLEYFDAVLTGSTDASVVYLSGPGGIGKSALLREVARRGRALGFTVAWLEGRDLPPFPEVVSAALAEVVGAERPLIVIDTFELVSSLEGYLRDVLMPDLPERALVLIASRVKPSRSWFEGGWDTVVAARHLEGLTTDELRQLARNLGVLDELVDDLVQRSAGSPLAVAVAAATGLTGSLADLADRLLGDEVGTDRFRTLGVAALARVTTPGLLAAVLPDQDTDESYKWLADRSFCEPLADGVTLHALVAKAVLETLRERDPSGEAELRRSTDSTWRWPSSSREPRSSSAAPTMPCSGVRISWLMLARKRLFTRTASSACSRVASSCASSARRQRMPISITKPLTSSTPTMATSRRTAPSCAGSTGTTPSSPAN